MNDAAYGIVKIILVKYFSRYWQNRVYYGTNQIKKCLKPITEPLSMVNLHFSILDKNYCNKKI